MVRLALFLVLALAAPLTACPEQRPPPEPPRRRTPQAALSAGGGAIDVLSVERPAEPEWFGLYLMGKKAGWSRSELRREIRDGRDLLVLRSETLIRATVGGREVERRQEEERAYEARPGGRLVSFRSVWAGDGGDRTVTGSCERTTCRAALVAGATREERVVEGVRDTADLAEGVRLAAARRGSVSGGQLDLEKLRVRDVQDAFVRRERVAGAGVQEEVSVVTEAEVGDRLAAEYRVADDGRIVEIRLGEAIVARPEPEPTAKRLDTVDLFALARVPLPRPLPRDVPKAIVFRLAGLPAAFQKNDARQRFERGPGGTAILTVTARRPAAADPARDTPLARARAGAAADDLASTPQANADAPEIQKLARDVAGNAKGSYEAARRLADHVHRTLEKAYGASHDRASDVLAAGKGDCTEHSVLLVALARALGIPARGVHGLVYARYDDGQDALYWHAWVEVRSGGEWIAMDPTFGQPVADATHVALGAGAQVDTVGLLGTLEVVGAEARDAR
ncbi:MAG TPA: transglutaminase-like domain-containing protein [Anaeromyxobacter sp.]|nr:transglutaminase-like domain-containing protein [Anaeromyxobacter sp.]